MQWNELEWRPRPTPLTIEAAFAHGEAARRLVTRLLDLDEANRHQLRGVCGDGFVVLIADCKLLPWCQGIRYLGRPFSGQSVYWPTERAPDRSANLLARRVVQHARAADLPGPYALIPEHALLVSLAEASPLAEPDLAAWLQSA